MTFDEWLIARLRLWGAYNGAYDGAHGRGVIQALERFQRASKLSVSGQADAATVAALRLNPGSKEDVSVDVRVPAEPVWMREARRFMGLKEIPGPKSNSTIIGWAKSFGGWVASYYSNDDTPWCGLFVGHTIAATLPREMLPKNPLGALEYNKLGRRLVEPALGAILTFTRSGGGHVAYYLGEDATHYHVIGANQSNSVNVTRIEKSRLSQIRWPSTGEAPVGGRIYLTAAGVPASSNEA